MFTFLGVIAILLGIAIIIGVQFIVKEDEYRDALNRAGQPIQKLVRAKSHPFLLKFKTKMGVYVAIGGVILFSIQGLFFYAQPGKAYAVQYITGGDKAIMTQGIKFKYWGKYIDISHEISIKDVLPGTNIDNESPFTYIQNTTKREFNDAVKGDVANTVVVAINKNDTDKFLTVATNNRSEQNLVSSRIIPFRDAVLKNTAKLMSAQDYIAGASSNFDFYFADQLENGMYALKEADNRRRIDTIGELGKTRTLNDNTQRKKYEIIYIKDSTGILVPKRLGTSLKKSYGLTVILAVVNKIDWEDKFDIRLDKQKEQVAATQLEKQMAEKAVFKRKRMYEEGEANKAEEQAKLEKEQISKTITAETAAKVAIFNLTESNTLYEKAVIDAKSKKVTADADAYRNLKLVKAGLTPQEKMQWEFDIANAVSGNIAKTKFPDVLITSGSSNGKGSETSILYDLLGAEVAKQMIPRTKTLTKKN